MIMGNEKGIVNMKNHYKHMPESLKGTYGDFSRNFPENTIVAKDKDKVIGFAVYSPSRDEDLPDAGEVDAIYVLSEYYGRKVGYRLMNEAISRLSEYNTFFVWVFEKNERAINFYHKYGFEFDGCKKEWTLGTPVTIVRMVMKRA